MCANFLLARIYYFARKGMITTTILVGVVWAWVTQGFDALRRGGWWSVYPLLIGLGAYPLCVYLHRRSIKKSGVFDSDIVADVRDKGLWQKDERGETFTFWESIKKIWETDDHFFFRSSGREGASLHCVPKHAFPNPEAANAFYRQALALWNTHRSAPATYPA